MCVLCGDLLENGNLCKKHNLPCDMIWCFSRRTGVVAKIIDDYKFNRVQAAAECLKKNGAKHVEIAVIARHGRPKL